MTMCENGHFAKVQKFTWTKCEMHALFKACTLQSKNKHVFRHRAVHCKHYIAPAGSCA